MSEIQRLIDECSAKEREEILAAAWAMAALGRLRPREWTLLEAIRRELDLPMTLAMPPFPGVESRLRNAFPSAKRGDRQPARALAFHPLPPLVPTNLIHFSCHDWVASRYQGE